MSNQRSVMTEFRFLDQKRQAEGLTAEEAARYAQLRDLVGPETAGPPRSGFDVNAAAARLRESLLPAGLRGRAPPPAAAPEPEPAPEAPPETLALEQAWAEAPFADLSPEPADPLFDPGSLANEVRPQAWNPEAPGYDPSAPYDEAAWIAAGYDPNATYDWSASGYGPDGQPVAADAGEAAPAELTAEPAAEPLPEPGAQPFDASLEGEPLEIAEAEVADAGPAAAAPVEDAWDAVPVEDAPPDAPALEAAPEPWDALTEAEPITLTEAEPPAQPWEVDLAEDAAAPPAEAGLAQDWGAPAPEPELLPLGEVEVEQAPLAAAPRAAPPAEEELPFDPNAPFDHAKWFGRSDVEAAGAPAAPAAVPGPPAPEPDLSFDLQAGPAAPAFGEYDDAAAAPSALAGALELTPAEDAVAPALDLGEAEPALQDAAMLDTGVAEPAGLDLLPAEPPADDAGWLGDAPPTTHLPAPAGAPFGAYDEAAAPLPGVPASDGDLAAMLPFDPAAASAIEPGAIPEGYEPGGPALDPASLPPADGAYDDAAAFAADQMYGGPEGDSLPGGAPLELGEGLPDWQPEAALEQGFELASDGSFGHPETMISARTPAWGTAVAAPAEGWESAPALDLAAPFEAPGALASAAEPLAEAPGEELPTIDGAELLEELPAEEPAPALDLAAEPPLQEPGASALDGAFEGAEAVEAAAYPPPDLADPFAEPAPEAPPAEPSFDLGPAPGPEVTADPFAEAVEAAPLEAAAPWSEPAPAPEAEHAVSYEAAPEGLPPEIAAAYASSAPSADTFELPPVMADALFDAPLSPEPEPEPLEAEPLPPPAPAVSVPGTHRVVLHTVDGQVKRGLLVDAVLDAPALPLQPQGPGTAEEIPAGEIKAIFFMLSPGEKAPAPEGKKVRVTFRDGRQVAGFSPDYTEGLVGFFMIPADTRTNTGRIWVYQSAVKTVAVS